MGGGLIAIPALGLLYGMDQQLAQGTALVMIAPNVVIGFWQYRRRADIALRTAAVLGLSAVVATYASARLATAIDAVLLRRIFACFIDRAGALFPVAPAARARCHGAAKPPVAALDSGARRGGRRIFRVLSVSAAAWWPRLPWWDCSATGRRRRKAWRWRWSPPGAVVALATYAHAGHVDWASGIPLSLGGMLTISWGVALAHRMPERRLRALFAVRLIATAAVMLARG
ncbi:sulfite exporter TauE/SafE family protein [Bradyrhizobium betae]